MLMWPATDGVFAFIACLIGGTSEDAELDVAELAQGLADGRHDYDSHWSGCWGKGA